MITQNTKVIMHVQLLLFNKELSLPGKESQNGFIKHFGRTTFPPHTVLQQLFESFWKDAHDSICSAPRPRAKIILTLRRNS